MAAGARKLHSRSERTAADGDAPPHRAKSALWRSEMKAAEAKVLCKHMPLKVVRTTFPLPKIGLSLVWHERTDADPGGRYFRDLVVEAVGQ